jgi:signal peptidase I
MESKTVTFFKELVTFGIVALVIVIPIRLFIAQPFIVSGKSMFPTFNTSQYLIVDQLSYRIREPQRGEVIIFHYPKNPSKFFIKRIIALPGEKIEIKDGKVLITNKEETETFVLEEDYIQIASDDIPVTKLSNGEYFVMGDNRVASLDSRIWGPLDKTLIVGRAYMRLFPINKIEFLPGNIK